MKRWHVILLACALPLREVHRFFSLEVRPGLYLLDKTIEESPAWYVHDIVTKVFLAITFGVWWNVERGKHGKYAKFLGVFTVFFTLDFILYLLNHSHAGKWYLLVYIPVLIYGLYITKQK